MRDLLVFLAMILSGGWLPMLLAAVGVRMGDGNGNESGMAMGYSLWFIGLIVEVLALIGFLIWWFNG